MTQVTYTDDEIITALREHGSNRKAAKALGCDPRTVERRRKSLAAKGYSPDHDMTRTVPDGFRVKGVSTYYDDEGRVRGQWVKSSADAERREAIIREVISVMAADFKPIKPRKPVRRKWRDDILSAYVIGDPHIGMRAWAEECGADWDLAIAQDAHRSVVHDLVERSLPTREALIVNLGDLLHYDSMEAKTPRSGHMLDADGRYNKMLKVAAEIMVQAVESALDHHQSVRVVNAIGNHDETGSQAVALALSHRYHNNRRVTVDTSPAVFNYVRWGDNIIGIHHGHTCKADKLPGVMATDRARDWGECTHRYWWTGHVHHESKREFPGVTVETFPSLAERDAYATSGGWRSRQGMYMLKIHNRGGEIGRERSNPLIAGFRLAGEAA